MFILGGDKVHLRLEAVKRMRLQIPRIGKGSPVSAGAFFSLCSFFRPGEVRSQRAGDGKRGVAKPCRGRVLERDSNRGQMEYDCDT